MTFDQASVERLIAATQNFIKFYSSDLAYDGGEDRTYAAHLTDMLTLEDLKICMPEEPPSLTTLSLMEYIAMLGTIIINSATSPLQL